MTRRELRESVFSLLFMREFYPDETFKEQLELVLTRNPDAGDSGRGLFEILKEENADSDISIILDAGYSDDDISYIKEKLDHVIGRIGEADQIISECSEGWKISRFNHVDLSILRLAVYEMLFDEDIPYRVAINEAVELAKKFGGDDSPSFINGILGKAAALKGLQN